MDRRFNILLHCFVVLLITMEISFSFASGFINGIQSINANVAVGIIMLMIGALFSGCAVTSMVLLIKVAFDNCNHVSLFSSVIIIHDATLF